MRLFTFGFLNLFLSCNHHKAVSADPLPVKTPMMTVTDVIDDFNPSGKLMVWTSAGHMWGNTKLAIDAGGHASYEFHGEVRSFPDLQGEQQLSPSDLKDLTAQLIACRLCDFQPDYKASSRFRRGMYHHVIVDLPGLVCDVGGQAHFWIESATAKECLSILIKLRDRIINVDKKTPQGSP